MAQGQPAVDWKKPENNAKLFAAVLALIPGTPDYKKIAAVFGPSVPGSAISYRLNSVRKEGVALGLSPGSGSYSPVKTNANAKRAAPAVKKSQPKGKGNGRKRGGILNDHASDDPDTSVGNDSDEEEIAGETDDENLPTTPSPSAKRQKTMGGRVSKRISPRKVNQADYKQLDDPFATMDNAKDEDGNNVFGEPSGTESEDTYATDGSFKEAEQGTAVKVEEAEEAEDAV